MAWWDNLQLEGKGSWRGVEFFVDAASGVSGRRTVVHEYPGRDTPTVEDIGRAARRLLLTCYVLGDDYDIARDLLRIEFETAGPGQLVHPYWGEFTAHVVSPVTFTEAPREGGVARFELDVVEVGDQDLTTVLPDLVALVDDAADAANSAHQESFETAFSVVGAVNAVTTAAVSVINELATTLRSVRGTLNSALSAVDDTVDALDALVDEATTLVLTPVLLASTVQGVVGDVMGSISQLDAAAEQLVALGARLTSPATSRISDDFRATAGLTAFVALAQEEQGLDDVPVTGSTQLAEEAVNQDQLVYLFRTAAAIEGARAFSELDYGSRDAAETVRDTVVDTFNALLLEADDTLWPALVDLRDRFVARMDDLSLALPALVEMKVPETMPALLAAHYLFGDASLDSELVLRNGITNPNFVPGQTYVEVVSE